MQEIKVDEKVAIYLDHCELINKEYNKSIVPDKEKYELKQELFDFKPKPTKEAEEESPVITKKRKRKQQTNNSNDNIEALEEIKQLKKDCHKFLTKLKHFEKFVQLKQATNLNRCWEQVHNFPKFFGANTTEAYQTFRYADNEYLIPPNCHFYNWDVDMLPDLLPQLTTKFDLIIMDPPWRNKYIRRLKRTRLELAYDMLSNTELMKLPITQFTHRHSLVAIWCTNAKQHQQALIEQFLPAWDLRLLHQLKWLKLNTSGQPIGSINGANNKQPYEMLYLACHKTAPIDFAVSLGNVEMLLSVPSVVHSHKPPLLSWLKHLLPEKPQCLEIFARYLQPEFTSVGLEVLKLMDARLYNKIES